MRSSNSQLRPTQAGRCHIAPRFREPEMSSRRSGGQVLRWHFLLTLLALLAGVVAASCAPAVSGAPGKSALVVAVRDQGQVAEWQLFTAPDKAFSVRLPGEPTVSTKPEGSNYLVRSGRDVTYVVFASSLGIIPVGAPFNKLLETTRDASIEPVREFGGHVVSSEFGRASGEPCITFFVEFKPQHFHRMRILSRIILAVGAPRFLTIAYSAPADEFQEQKAKDFLDSLTLLEGSR
jgi:hypothetical protein